MAVIAADGYAGASLRKVAERAECTTGAVTYYFASREEMIVAVVESVFDEFDALLESDGDVDVKEILRRSMGRTKPNDANLLLVLFQMLAHARHEPAFAGVVQKRYAKFRHSLAAVLAKAQSRGTVRDDIPADLLADQLSAMSDGWMMMLPIEPKRFEAKRLRLLLDAVERLISPPSPRRPAGR